MTIHITPSFWRPLMRAVIPLQGNNNVTTSSNHKEVASDKGEATLPQRLQR